MTAWQQVAIALLALLGGSGGLVALIRAFTDRPKVQADAAQIITASATTQMTNMERRLERVETKHDAARQLLDETREQLDETDRKAAAAEREAKRLAAYQRRATDWHVRHVPFDEYMANLAEQLRGGALKDPAALDGIPEIEPFPRIGDPQD